MPQGGIDTNEIPREAALRELAEETGIPPQAVADRGRDAGLADLRPAARMRTRAAVAVQAGKPLEIMEVNLEGPKGAR
jgi:8-oxo-dGTP pyrophosphatase MutT (NUDIX family)